LVSDSKLKGKSQEEIIEEWGRMVGVERGYFIIRERDDGSSWFDKICSENLLEGLN